MNAAARSKVIDRIKQIGLPDFATNRMPLLTLEEFFTGNDYDGAIGCNLMPAIGPEKFFERLKWIRSQEGVENVLVEVTEVEESDESMWPFSDTVYVYGTISGEKLREWAAPLNADEVGELPGGSTPYNPPQISRDARRYCLWWD